MTRRPATSDVLIALAAGLEMQVELLFVDAPRRDILVSRAMLLGLAVAVLVQVTLEVTDLGDTRPELLGMRERVELYGGHLVTEAVAGAGYRVVQEALTNAIKHAGGATTRVDLTWGDDALELRVADDGDGGPSPELAGAGHGVIGMRERIRVHGGELLAGPRPGGGFEVVARLPLVRETASVA